jgi:hypothetical protein
MGMRRELGSWVMANSQGSRTSRRMGAEGAERSWAKACGVISGSRRVGWGGDILIRISA